MEEDLLKMYKKDWVLYKKRHRLLGWFGERLFISGWIMGVVSFLKEHYELDLKYANEEEKKEIMDKMRGIEKTRHNI